MKEFNFSDQNGLEESNIARQLDEFELPYAKALNIRSVFDFSESLIASSDTFNSSNRVFWKNRVADGDEWDYYKGSPGNAQLLVDGKPVWISGYPTNAATANPYFITETVKDVEGNKDVPVWDENAIIYLDEPTTSFAGGTISNQPNKVKDFRSGYVEFTIKTEKNNCIIAFGSAKFRNSAITGSWRYPIGASEAETSSSELVGDNVHPIDGSTAVYSDIYENGHTLKLFIKDGKIFLDYINEFGENQNSFSILGNTTVSDNEWHHVVINFGKPGVTRQGENKFNKRFIEFWVDGQLDKRTENYVNDSQVYFPVLDWLLMDPILILNKRTDIWNEFDVSNSLPEWNSTYNARFFYDNTSNLINRDFSNAKATAFSGSINHFVGGLNAPLSKKDIQLRNSLYRGNNRRFATTVNVTAEMVNPQVTSNKKKALKLYWNSLVNDGKFGLELDKNFDSYSYSVTHRTKNSPTEIFNVDVANSKKINYLPDARIALTDNLFIFAPGKEPLFNFSALSNSQLGVVEQTTPANMSDYSAFYAVDDVTFAQNVNSGFSEFSVKSRPFSGLELKTGDRILLTNQINSKENGLYIFNGYGNVMTRDENADSPSKISNGVIRVTDGYFKDTSWALDTNIDSFSKKQKWIQLDSHPTEETLAIQPLFIEKWSDEYGNQRFIDLESDLNMADFDLIVFMNYPENDLQVEENFVGYSSIEISKFYQNFIKSLKTVCANGAKLFVSSPKLAQDLGIVKKFTEIDQSLDASDARSSVVNPFQFDEPAERYFDTHRINAYHLDVEIPGLTNKETWVLTEAINYIPKDSYDFEQWHLKYSYRQLGLQEGNEFLIPSLALTQSSVNPGLPGFRSNARVSSKLNVVNPSDILSGTVVTSLVNTYYENDDVVNNIYDDYASTIIVHNGQLLGGTPINGKIFVNCVEDSYTLSREDYNKAVIQVIPEIDSNETISTRAWQYSTSRLDRLPKRSNVRSVTTYGQTSPTLGGGGPLIQSATNSSNGIVRSETDRDKEDFTSDLYPTVQEEIYPLQEIPVLSMTMLGLKWLIG